MALRLRQGLSSDRTSITPASGELIYTTDTKLIYVGDGTTPGGNSISAAIPVTINSLTDVVISGATSGQVLKFDGANWINDVDSGGSPVTYSLSAETAAFGANLRITGSDASTDNVTFLGSGGVTISRTDANTITVDATGVGTGTMSSFSIEGDDSTPSLIEDGDHIRFQGSGSISVIADSDNVVTITNTERVSVGTSGSLAFYNSNTSAVQSTDFNSLNYDNVTGQLFSTRLETNAIVTDNAVLPIVNRSASSPFVTFGATLDGTDYSTQLSVNSASLDANLVHSVFRNVYSSSSLSNAIIIARSRGTYTAETAVQANDFLGSVFFTGYDGSAQRASSFITAQVETVGAGSVTGSLIFGTVDSLGAFNNVLVLTNNKYAVLGGPLLSPPQELDFSSGDITLAVDDIASNHMYSSGMSTNQDLTLPNPSSSISGLRLCVINKDATWVITIKYGLTTITTANALTVKEIYCDGTDWNILY
jgi:hypothetical protein